MPTIPVTSRHCLVVNSGTKVITDTPAVDTIVTHDSQLLPLDYGAGKTAVSPGICQRQP